MVTSREPISHESHGQRMNFTSELWIRRPWRRRYRTEIIIPSHNMYMSCLLEKGLTQAAVAGETNSLASFVFGSTAFNVRCYAEQKAYVSKPLIYYFECYEKVWQKHFEFWGVHVREICFEKGWFSVGHGTCQKHFQPKQSQMKYHNNIFTKSGLRPFKLLYVNSRDYFLTLHFGPKSFNPKIMSSIRKSRENMKKKKN